MNEDHRRRLPTYNDQVSDNNNHLDTPLNFAGNQEPFRKRHPVDAPPSFERRQHEPNPLPTYTDQANSIPHLQHNYDDDNNSNDNSAIAMQVSPIDINVIRKRDTERLPDFKDQARSGFAPRIFDDTNAVVVDLSQRIPNYKDQAASQHDNRITGLPLTYNQRDSSPMEEPRKPAPNPTPKYKDQANSIPHLQHNNDEYNNSAIAVQVPPIDINMIRKRDTERLPDFKDQARSGVAPRIVDDTDVVVDDVNHRLPNYKDQAANQNDNRITGLPLTYNQRDSSQMDEQRQQARSPLPTYKDQTNYIPDQRRSSNRDSNSGAIAVLVPPVDINMAQKRETERLPDFKDQARTGITSRFDPNTDAVVVDRLPNYKDQAISQNDAGITELPLTLHQRDYSPMGKHHEQNPFPTYKDNTNITPLVQHNSEDDNNSSAIAIQVPPIDINMVQKRETERLPYFKDQARSGITPRIDHGTDAVVIDSLPNYKDQAMGEHDVRITGPPLTFNPRVSSSTGETLQAISKQRQQRQPPMEQELPDYKDQVQSTIQVHGIPPNFDNIVNTVRRPKNIDQASSLPRQQHVEILPNYKDQIQSVIDVRPSDGDVNTTTSTLPRYIDQVAAHEHKVQTTSLKKLPTSEPYGQQNLPEFKDQAKSIVQVHAVDVADLTRFPDYKDQVLDGQEQRGSLNPSSEQSGVERLPDFKDQIQSVLEVRVNAAISRLNYQFPNGDKEDNILSTSQHHTPIPQEQLSQNITSSKNTLEQVRHAQVTDVADTRRHPDYKDQVLDEHDHRRIQNTSTNLTTPSQHEIEQLPDYKDQAQSALHVQAQEPDGIRLPDFKDQVQGENDRHNRSMPLLLPVSNTQSSHSRASKVESQTKGNVVQRINPIDPDLLNYKAQALDEEQQVIRRHASKKSDTSSSSTNPAEPSSVVEPTNQRQLIDVDEEFDGSINHDNVFPNRDTAPSMIENEIAPDSATVAFAEPYRDVPLYHASEPIVPQGNVAYAEGVGVLIDILYDNDEVSTPAENIAPVIEEVTTDKNLDKQRRRRIILAIGSIVLLIVGTVIGGVCGSGACTRSSGTLENNIIPPSTTISPNDNYPIAFTSTDELYNAVDEYIGAFYGTGSNPQESDVTTIYGPITDWDVSQLTNLALVFYAGDRSTWDDIGADIYRATIPTTPFNEDVSRWNVSSATTLEGMFAGAVNITQLDLSNWDTSRVTTMRGMFYSASLYNGNLGNWNVESVTDFTGMFAGCLTFQGNGLESWNTLSAQNFRGMFTRTPNFAIDLSTWNTSQVTDISRMFDNAALFNSNLPWDVSQVTTMVNTFNFASSFKGNVSTWDTSKCTDMSSMFASAFFDGDISSWNTGQVIRMSNMFEQSVFFNSNISDWNVSNVVSTSRMFRGASAFNQDLSQWDISQVTAMDAMFQDATSFSQNLCIWGNRIEDTGTLQLNDIFESAVSCESTDTPNITNLSSGPWCSLCTTTV